MFWINPADWNNASSAGIIDFTNASATQGVTIYDDGVYPTKLNARIYPINYFTSSQTVNIGSWQNWTLTRTVATGSEIGSALTSSLRWYYNGQLDSKLATGSIDNITASNVNLSIARSVPWGGWFSGSIASVYIYNVGLNSEQVLIDYNIKAAKYGLPTYTASIG